MPYKTLLLCFMLCTSATIIPTKSQSQVAVDFQVFYDELTPYGMWMDNPKYGYVWMPNVSAGFSPYATNGYWVYTDMGWTWVSDYAWGWATFHYGRWFNDVTYGPMWVPGYEWGPGWVSWRSSASYYGWAPMGPGISPGMAYSNGYYDNYNYYTFVACRHMGHHNIHNYYENSTNNTIYINNTTVINTTVNSSKLQVAFSPGPDRREVENHVGKPVQMLAIKDERKPTQSIVKNELHMYRPQISKPDNDRRPAPNRVGSEKAAEEMNRRRANTPSKDKVLPKNEQKRITPAPSAEPRQTNPLQPGRIKPLQPSNPQKKIPTSAPVNRYPVQPQPNNRIQPDKPHTTPTPNVGARMQPQQKQPVVKQQVPSQKLNSGQNNRPGKLPRR